MTTQTDGVLFMHRKVYLALYKGRADKFSYRFYDAVTRFSHMVNTHIVRLQYTFTTTFITAIHRQFVMAVCVANQ